MHFAVCTDKDTTAPLGSGKVVEMKPHALRILWTLAVVVAACTNTAWAADPIVGKWQTQPDRKNLTSHIQISSCRDGFCGLILAAFDQSGKEMTTPNIGKPLFWGVKRTGAGRYGGGIFWVPLVNVKVTPKMSLKGNSLKVIGCKMEVCEQSLWTRM
ncbi:DUF2147 domain-containing protein [Parasedimentitalea psychrophila]|uniref:DUF2147 domain-containing protein n=1 Tax=Parasedimentitalea psychrophila TaxID=2997337 RepID=A0A9Y2KZ04_9RHOB|nr:DUF2147 domain-containing protein [Parasedimentitalea psychrophila]WIY24352.1 DUF2147 domain-containing protein [Parasedimentitalea psychrophila]